MAHIDDVKEWESVHIPPANSRVVMLRFDDDGQRDCIGFYWRPERSWYKSDGSKARRNAVHPVMWGELSDEYWKARLNPTSNAN